MQGFVEENSPRNSQEHSAVSSQHSALSIQHSASQRPRRPRKQSEQMSLWLYHSVASHNQNLLPQSARSGDAGMNSKWKHSRYKSGMCPAETIG